MRRNRVLVLVCTQNHANKISADINDSTVVVTLEYSAQEELDKYQISYHIPEDYTSNETYNDLDKKALSFARTWHGFNAHVEELVTKDIPDHIFVYGNSVKIRGWICERREKLEFKNNRAICNKCEKEYKTLNENKVICDERVNKE